MEKEFTFESRRQEEWSWLIATGFFLAGSGAGLYLVSFFLNLVMISLVGIALSALGGLALLLDLGRPERFWLAFVHLGTSWISRGIVLIFILLIFGLLYILPEIAWFSWLPWSSKAAFGYILGLIAAIASFGVMGYTGFVLAYSPAIPLWNTTLLPILFILYSLLGALGVIFALSPIIDWEKTNMAFLELMEISLVGAGLLILAVYLLATSYSTVAARAALRLLLHGKLAFAFLGGTVFIGLIIPLAMSLWVYLSGAGLPLALPVLVTAGLLELAGGFLLRYSLIHAGVYVPLM